MMLLVITFYPRSNPKTLSPGPRTTLWSGPWTTPTDPLYGPPQNSVKIINQDFTYGLSNRFKLVSVIFQVLHCANVTDLDF